MAGWFIVTVIGGLLIGRLLRFFPLKSIPGITDQNDENQSLARAGMVIGYLERTLIYLFMLVGVPTGAGLVLAAKSIARIPKFTQQKDAECFIIGNLASVTWGVLVAAAVQILLA